MLFVIVLLRSIWMFTKFDTPWLMIQGGGAETYIRTLPVYTYQRTFAYYEAGLGSAMAVLMFLMLVGAPRSISASGGGRSSCERADAQPRGATVSAALALFFVAFPFAWMVSTAFKPSRRSSLAADVLAAHVHAREPRAAVRRDALSHLLPQQRLRRLGTVLLTLAVATPGAYGLTRFPLPPAARRSRRPSSSPTCSRRS